MEIQKAGQTSVRKFKVFLGQLPELLIQFLTPLSPRDGCSEVVVSFGTDELPNGIQLLPICKGRREDGTCTGCLLPELRGQPLGRHLACSQGTCISQSS